MLGEDSEAYVSWLLCRREVSGLIMEGSVMALVSVLSAKNSFAAAHGRSRRLYQQVQGVWSVMRELGADSSDPYIKGISDKYGMLVEYH